MYPNTLKNIYILSILKHICIGLSKLHLSIEEKNQICAPLHIFASRSLLLCFDLLALVFSTWIECFVFFILDDIFGWTTIQQTVIKSDYPLTSLAPPDSQIFTWFVNQILNNVLLMSLWAQSQDNSITWLKTQFSPNPTDYIHCCPGTDLLGMSIKSRVGLILFFTWVSWALNFLFR